MSDIFTPAERSRVMRAVKGEDTAPERIVRSLVHRLGFRFRLQGKNLPGKPDLVLPRHRVVIFVHGCFWHGHGCPRGSRKPKTRADYWRKKIGGNAQRDQRTRRALQRTGWRVLTIWECQTKASQRSRLSARIQRFLVKQ